MDTTQSVEKFLQETAEKQASIFLSTNEVDIVFQTKIIQVDNNELVLENRVPIDHISSFVNSEKFYIQLQLLRLEADEIRSNGLHIIFPLSGLKNIQDNRGAKRFFFSGSEDVYLEVMNPYDKETLLKKPVIDISTTGISIKSPVQSNLYVPGTQFQNMKILVDGEVYNRTDGQVIYSRRFLDLQGKYYYQIGFQFDSVE